MSPSPRPPFFQWSEPTLFDEWLRIGLRRSSGHTKALYPIEREILMAWRQLCDESQDAEAVFDLGDLHEVMDRQAGRDRIHSGIRRVVLPRLGLLSHAGILWREKADSLGMKRAYRFTLRSPAKVASNWVGGAGDSQENKDATKADRRRQEVNQELVESTHRHLSALGYMAHPAENDGSQGGEPWTLHLISQLIEKCSRSNSRSQEEFLEAVIRLNGEPVQVEAGRVYHKWENSLEYGLITADDAQLILAIFTLAMQTITKDLEEGTSPPRNRISFDLYELSKMLSPSGGRYAYRPYQKSMARIINTEYRLTPLSQDGPRSRVHFRLVEDVVEGEDNESFIDGESWEPRNNMRYFSFSLNSHIWRGLLNRQDWLVHPKLLHERDGLVHKVYHHLRTNAGREHPYSVTGEELMQHLNLSRGKNVSRGRTKFCEALWTTLKDRGESDRPLFDIGEQSHMALRLFDLDIVVRRDDSSHKGGLRIEALQSPETHELLLRQRQRLRELRERLP